MKKFVAILALVVLSFYGAALKAEDVYDTSSTFCDSVMAYYYIGVIDGKTNVLYGSSIKEILNDMSKDSSKSAAKKLILEVYKIGYNEGQENPDMTDSEVGTRLRIIKNECMKIVITWF